MNVYAESSAVLSWLLGEPDGAAVRTLLDTADLVLTSDLTIMECKRSLIRAQVTERIPDEQAEALRVRLEEATGNWDVFPISVPIVERAGLRFPEEPVRSLDAIHLATADLARSEIDDLVVVSLDGRVRGNALALGFGVLPSERGNAPDPPR